MDELKLPELPVVAWMVSGGRTFIDQCVMRETTAAERVAERKDGSTASPLCDHSAALAAVAQARADERERCAKICEDRGAGYSAAAIRSAEG